MRSYSEVPVGTASDPSGNLHTALKLRVVQVVREMTDHEHGIYALQTASKHFPRQTINTHSTFPMPYVVSDSVLLILALPFADVLQNGCVLNFVISVGLYFGCDTVERVFEGFL